VRQVGVDRYVVLGDLVGYGADPGTVVDTLRGCEPMAVAGNHDHASAGMMDLDWFNPYARAAAEWTAGQLRAEQIRYLAELPLVREEAGATLVHASPLDPGEWTYLVSARDGARVFPAFATSLCFVGHSHVPATWVRGEDERVTFAPGPAQLTLRPGHRYVINVGSVGQPRDGDPAAAYAVWDLEAASVEVRRVGYDADEACRRIHAAGLPKILGDRLLRGR
jgi:diadenosine tetraphosphatase ApaH/serine/threonine PP2A family protein phosphatase